MKAAVIKLGGRITWDTSAGVAPGEAGSICKALVRGGAEVHVYTALMKKDTLHPSITWHDILDTSYPDINEQDVLFVINGNVNFFGGAEDEAQIANYRMLNNFKGKVVYVMCDPELPLMQIWENVSKKEWGSKYSKDDILITRTDIHVLSQPYALEAMKKHWPTKGVKPGNFFHFPMDRFPMLNEFLEPAHEPTVDLLYGGTPRGGRRIPNLYKWYCNLPADISVEIFGSIDETDFHKHPKVGPLTAGQELMHMKHGSPSLRYPTFTGKVKYDEVLSKMNTGLAHLVTGDGSYEVLDIIPQRVAECFAAGNIVFVDANMDKSRRIYPAGEMAHDFLYVANQAELVDRLRIVKADSSIRLDLLYAQKVATNFNADEFCQSLVQTVEAL
jgi:hypothetical protein